MNNIESKVELIVKNIINNLGYEIYDIQYTKEGQNNYLRIFIDKDGIIDINDCEKVNNAINDILDIEDPIKESYFSCCTELLDDKFAMVESANINIYKNDSLDILYTIPVEVKDENDYDWNKKVTSIFCMQNGNLFASTYDGKIYIFKIKDSLYEKILEFEDESEHILGFIELKNKNILTFSKSKTVKVYRYIKKYIIRRISI